jgi:type IV pilus assembly protein PilY1
VITVNFLIRDILKLNLIFRGLCAAAALLLPMANAHAAIATTPLVEKQNEPPLILLTVGRDEQLYYAAYNDYSDIDGDGTIDVDYKPGVITYYGLFDSLKCYDYVKANERFEPRSSVTNQATKTCGAGVAWSGDWLNYMTTSRVDAVRRVLYGGQRYIDGTETVLQRAYVPQDAHVWGKEFSTARSTYDINQYTPFGSPTSNVRQHLFANATSNGSAANPPLFRVLVNRTERIWNWVAQEGPVGGTKIDGTGAVAPEDFVVRVLVCVTSGSFPMEPECKGYPSLTPTSWKPTGILHDYGADRSVAFGLLTGSYENARQGGVIRKNVSFFVDEFSATTGQFTSNSGVVANLDKLRIYQWSGNNGGGGSYQGVKDYGNPVAEMMYEGLRYFAGAGSGLAAYGYAGGADVALGLTKPNWLDPYRGRTDGGFASCAKPFQMVISDTNPTFDSDDLPGSPFGTSVGAGTPAVLSSLNVSTLGTSIWSSEGLATGGYFIGQSLSNIPAYDQAPTAKSVTSFGNIRGISPEQPTREGSYFAGSVAKFGAENPISSVGNKRVETYAIALAPSLPKIEIPTGLGKVSIAPFGKSTNGCNYGEFVVGTTFLTNRIVGFYFTEVFNVPGFPTNALQNSGRPIGKFRVSFEDNEQGTDNDMDAIVVYDFLVNADQSVTINLFSEYAAGCIGQRMGFTISGTTTDGAFLGVRDRDNSATAAQAYALEDPANSSVNKDAAGLGFQYSRTFIPSGAGTAGGNIPHDPLWYAAKYGVVASNRNLPPGTPIWDANNDGVPDNYALVTNPVKLKAQVAAAIDAILAITNDTAAVSASGGLVRTDTSTGTLGFSGRYSYGNTSVPRTSGSPITASIWEGQVDAIKINSDGSLGNVVASTSNSSFLSPTTREVVTKVNGAYVNFRPSTITGALVTALAPTSVQTLLTPTLTAANAGVPLNATQLEIKTAEAVTKYLLGDQSLELGNGGPLRVRSQILGDIIGSTPAYDGKIDRGYAGTTMPGAAAYSTHLSSKTERVWVGANDGMLHAFDPRSPNLRETWAFIPTALQGDLFRLTQPGYVHRYYVNGEVAVGDVYNGTWRSIVVASTGAGARTVVAIDATSGTPSVLWEFTAPDMGFVLGKLKIARVQTSTTTSTWAVIFGNGYEADDTTKSRLFVLDAITGAQLGSATRLTVPPSVAYNGMGTPAVVAGGDSLVTDIWAGDLGGNLWRFDMSYSAESVILGSSWGILHPNRKPVFTAQRLNNATTSVIAQPITAEPAVTKHPSRGWVVAFGTGKFFETEDRLNTEIQSVYTVFDELSPYLLNGLGVSNAAALFDLKRANLVQRVITSPSAAFRTLTAGTIAVTGKPLGWYFDLLPAAGQAPTGERVVASAKTLVPNSFFGTIATSTDTCSGGSFGYFMAAGWLSGFPEAPLFDVNGDGKLTNVDDGLKAGVRSQLRGDDRGFIADFGLISTADGGNIAFVGMPWQERGNTPNANQGLNTQAPKVKLFAGRTSWRQLK